MLQQAALETWSHPDAERFREAIDYTGVYVPADITWSMQLTFLGGGRLDETTHEVLARAAFTSHVLRALALAMGERLDPQSDRPFPHRRLSIREDKHAEIALAISEAWHVTLSVPTLRSLALSLSRRLQLIGEIANLEQRLSETGREERLLRHDFLNISFLPAISHAIDVFEDGARSHEHWAFLFDELEIAPSWIRSELLALLRSTDQRLLFKLTLSPYKPDPATVGIAVPEERQDHDSILLWYAQKDDSYPFSESLWSSITAARYGEAVAAVDMLGHAPYETTPSDWADEGTAYVRGSDVSRVFEELWELDPTFREYLQNRGIDARFLADVPAGDRAAVLRKIAPIAYLRREYLRETVSDDQRAGRRAANGRRTATVLRSRKNPTVFSGAETVFAVCEGNPRMLLGLAEDLLRASEGGIVEPSKQARAITAASRTFAAMIRNAPVPYTTGVGVLTLLRKVGEYIFAQVVRNKFNPEPPGSFIVDSHISDELEAALGIALNIRAIVYLPDHNAEFLLKSLRGKRFRLSYMLSVNFRNPLRLGRAVSLSSMLGIPATDAAQLLLGDSSNESENRSAE